MSGLYNREPEVDPPVVSAAQPRHIDLVKHDWSNLRLELQDRIPEDDPRSKLAGKDGDYSHYSELHTMEECPWPV